MEIGDRLTLIMKIKDLTQKELGSIAGYSDVAIGKMINHGAEPKFGLLCAIVKRFPDVNSRWILTGEGGINSKDLSFENDVEVLRYVVENQKELKKLKSFSMLLSDIKEEDNYLNVEHRLLKLEKEVKKLSLNS